MLSDNNVPRVSLCSTHKSRMNAIISNFHGKRYTTFWKNFLEHSRLFFRELEQATICFVNHSERVVLRGVRNFILFFKTPEFRIHGYKSGLADCCEGTNKWFFFCYIGWNLDRYKLARPLLWLDNPPWSSKDDKLRVEETHLFEVVSFQPKSGP